MNQSSITSQNNQFTGIHKKQEKTKLNITIILVIFIICEFLLTIVYSCKYFTLYSMNSDLAGDAVFAKMLAQSGKLMFSNDWFPTTELYTIHHQLIMTPLFYLFEDYHLVWHITTAIAFILVATVYYYFLRTIGCNQNKSLLAILLTCNPVNVFLVQFTILFSGYLFYVLLATLYLTLFIKLMYKQVNKIEQIAFMILSFLSGLCGIRMYIILFVPLAICLFIKNIHFELTKKSLKNKKIILTVISYLVGFIGVCIYYFYLCSKYGGDSRLDTVGIPNTEISNNIRDIPLMLLESLGFNIAENKIMKIQTMEQFIILAFSGSMLFANVYAAIKSKKEDNKVNFAALFNVICMLVSLILMLFTTYNSWFVNSSRYIGLSFFLFVPVGIATIKNTNQLTIKKVVLTLFLGLAILVGMHSYIEQIGDIKNKNNEREGYMEFLDTSGFKFGAATYWNADITMFLSKTGIELKPANSATDLNMFEWNTKKSYQNRKPEFFLLTKDEYEERVKAGLVDKILYIDNAYVIVTSDTF